MSSALGSILRQHNLERRLNILTFPTHERYQSNLAETNADYYMVTSPQVKGWNKNYAPIPSNHFLLAGKSVDSQLPPNVNFDLVFSQNKFGQFQIAKQLASKLQIPLVSLEHTLPVELWPQSRIEECLNMRGDLNVFISEYSIKKWGWDKNDPSVRVVHHGIDTDTFSPNDLVIDKKRQILSVVNDWINRDYFCGFELWRQVTRGLPVLPIGDTPGLSSPAKSVHELVMRYRESVLFINTSLVSPIPTALLEAMACGCAVVSTANCMIPEIIENEKNGFISNKPEELRNYCQYLLDEPELCAKIGQNARQTILEKFSKKAFVQNWEKTFRELIQ